MAAHGQDLSEDQSRLAYYARLYAFFRKQRGIRSAKTNSHQCLSGRSDAVHVGGPRIGCGSLLWFQYAQRGTK